MRRAGRAHEGVAQTDDRIERALGVDAAVLDVVTGADRAGQVAERAAQEARAEVDPEDERRFRDRLEVDGAVRRACGPAAASRTSPAPRSVWSASETVGFEMPARRAISAREIGAPLRIVSRTVSSFRRFSSGGVATRPFSSRTLTVARRNRAV